MAAAVIPLIVITGPTASGKTEVAIRLAEEFGGEIVCADSRTVYKGLDVGTAKPTASEQARVPHHLLDMVEPDERYNLARFQRDAKTAIADIRARGKVPFLVGGSGLYVDSIVLDYELGDEPDAEFRTRLEAMPLEELLQYCKSHNIELPNNLYNKRYMIRAIEQKGVNRRRRGYPGPHTVVVAVETDLEILKQRIQRRATSIFKNGLREETETAAEMYGWDTAPLRAPAYRAVRRFLRNELTCEQAIDAFARADWQLARKQMTWLRRHDWITWLPLEQVEPYVRSILTRRASSTVPAEH